MIIYVRNKNLEIIDLIDDAQSVIWTERFFDCGDFEIYIEASTSNLSKVMNGYFLTREDSETVMVIEHINIKTDLEAGNWLTVSGRCAKSILERRCVGAYNMQYYGEYNSSYALLLDHILYEVSDEAYVYEFHGRVSSPEREVSIISQSTRYIYQDGQNGLVRMIDYVHKGSLLNIVVEASKNVRMGISFKLLNSKLYLKTTTPTDRSESQNVNPRVVFSDEYSNLLNSNYDKNMSGYRNCAFVWGEGDGYDRKLTRSHREDNSNQSGLDLCEQYIDARDLTSKESDDSTMTDYEYNNLLKQRGVEKLSEHGITETFDGEVEPSTNYTYKTDYFLGDLVTIENEFGLRKTVRITAVTECEDDNGHYFIPSFEADEGDNGNYILAENGAILETENAEYLELE